MVLNSAAFALGVCDFIFTLLGQSLVQSDWLDKSGVMSAFSYLLSGSLAVARVLTSSTAELKFLMFSEE